MIYRNHTTKNRLLTGFLHYHQKTLEGFSLQHSISIQKLSVTGNSEGRILLINEKLIKTHSLWSFTNEKSRCVGGVLYIIFGNSWAMLWLVFPWKSLCWVILAPPSRGKGSLKSGRNIFCDRMELKALHKTFQVLYKASILYNWNVRDIGGNVNILRLGRDFVGLVISTLCTCLMQGKKHCLKIPKGDVSIQSVFCFASLLLWRPVLNTVWPDSSIWKEYRSFPF